MFHKSGTNVYGTALAVYLMQIDCVYIRYLYMYGIYIYGIYTIDAQYISTLTSKD